MEYPEEAIQAAIEKAEEWPEMHGRARELATSRETMDAVMVVTEMVTRDLLSPEKHRVATRAAGEAVALAAMSRKAHREQALKRDEIASIHKFIKWIFNGLWE